MTDKLLERAQAKVSSANKVVAGLVLALLATWNTGLEPTYAKLRDIFATRKAVSQVRNARENYVRVVPDTYDSKTVDVAGKRYSQREIERVVRNLRQQEAKRAQELRALRRETRLPLKLYGLEFPIKPVYAPLLWLFGVATTLSFVVATRSEVLNLVCRAIRKTATPTDLAVVMEDHPWWFHPVPRRAGSSVSTTQLRDSLGLGHRHARSHLVAFVCLIAAVLLALRVGWIAYISARILPEDAERWYVPTTFTIVVLVLVLVAYLAVRSARVPDDEPYIPFSAGLTRREILTIGVTSVVAISSYPLFRIQKRVTSPSPRFRPWHESELLFRSHDITPALVSQIQVADDPVMRMLRIQLNLAQMSENDVASVTTHRLIAERLNKFMQTGGAAKLVSIATRRASQRTKRLVNKPGRVGSLRFARSILNDTHPRLFAPPRRRWVPPPLLAAEFAGA